MLKYRPLPARKPLAQSLLVALTLSGAAPLAHSVWDFYPEATVEAGVDDNLPLNVGIKDDATTLAVEGKLIARNVSETHDVRATVALRQAEFGGTTQDGGTSGVANINAEKRSERITYGVLGNYTHQPLRRSGAIDLTTGQVLGSPEDLLIAQLQNPNLDPNLEIGFVEDKLRQKLLFALPFIEYQFSDRTRVRLTGEFQDTTFSGDNVIGLEDSQQFGASLAINHQLSERTSLIGSAATRKFEPDNSPEVIRHDITAGISRQISETARIDLEAGVGFADSDNGQKDTVPVYRATLLKFFEKGQLHLYAERANWPTGFGNVVETDLFEARWIQPLSELWGLQLRGNFTTTNSNLDTGVNPNDRDYADVEARLNYSLSPAWKTGVAYRYRWLDQKLQPRDAHGNAGFVFLTYSPPRPF